MDDHVEEHGADAREEAGVAGQHRGGRGHSVDHEHVLVGEVELDLVVPLAPGFVDPVRAIELDDQAHIGLSVPGVVDIGQRDAAVGLAGVGDDAERDDRRVVARDEGGRVDLLTVPRDRQCPRSVAKEVDDRHRRPAEGVAEVGRIEHPDIGPTDTRCSQLGGEGGVLTTMGCGDKCTRFARSGEDDIARLITDEQCALDVRDRAVDPGDADAVREVIDDPHFVIVPRRDGDRFEADGDGSAVLEPVLGHLVDFESIVRRVHRVEVVAVR